MRHPIYSVWNKLHSTRAGDSRKAKVHAYLMSLSPTFYTRFNEDSGNLINYGSDGGSGAVSNCTYAQLGQLGSKEAYLYNGTNSLCTFTNASVPGTKALTTRRECFLVNMSSLGESTAGTFTTWSGTTEYFGFTSTNRMQARIIAATQAAQVLTNNNQVDFLGSWALVFMDYDNTNTLGLGRCIRILRATYALPTTLLTLATNTAAIGAVTVPVANFLVGNDATLVTTLAGLVDFAFRGPGLWSPAGLPADLTVPNYLRTLVFGV